MNPEPLNPHNIFLIGYRCTGKTSVGQRLAKELGWSFVDTDLLIVKQQRMSIKEIIGAHGWENFRQMEHAMLKTVCTSQGQVVATGGGIVLNEHNVTGMRDSGRILWLRAGYETIKSRMLQDKDTMDFRPALTANDSLSEIEGILESREPLYKNAMDLSIDTDDLDIRAVTSVIIEKLRIIHPKII